MSDEIRNCSSLVSTLSGAFVSTSQNARPDLEVDTTEFGLVAEQHVRIRTGDRLARRQEIEVIQ